MQLDIGMLLDGTVSAIASYGAFVSLPDNKKGLIHISEVSDGFVKDIREFLKEGDRVRVKVIKLDEAGKVSLSLRQAAKDANHTAAPMQFELKRQESSSFEDMMSRFMSCSHDKLSDLKERGEVTPKRRRRE